MIRTINDDLKWASIPTPLSAAHTRSVSAPPQSWWTVSNQAILCLGRLKILWQAIEGNFRNPLMLYLDMLLEIKRVVYEGGREKEKRRKRKSAESPSRMTHGTALESCQGVMNMAHGRG